MPPTGFKLSRQGSLAILTEDWTKIAQVMERRLSRGALDDLPLSRFSIMARSVVYPALLAFALVFFAMVETSISAAFVAASLTGIIVSMATGTNDARYG